MSTLSASLIILACNLSLSVKSSSISALLWLTIANLIILSNLLSFIKFLINPSSNKIFAPYLPWFILSLSTKVWYRRTCSNLPISCNNPINSANSTSSWLNPKFWAILFEFSATFSIWTILIFIFSSSGLYFFTYSLNAFFASIISISILLTFLYPLFNIFICYTFNFF